MSARIKHASLYLATILACYFVAWTTMFVLLNGPAFAVYFEYLGYFWSSGGGERPMLTGMFSIVLTIPLAAFAIWLLRRGLRKQNEKRA